MKVKQKPEDFIVNEIVNLPDHQDGEYSVYRMTKKNIGTIEAINFISRIFRINRNRVSFAGLKDTHAQSTQYISIKNSPKKNFTFKNISLEYLFNSKLQITTNNLIGNKFDLTIRDLSATECVKVEENIYEVCRYGVPNYFDLQRFGSARHQKGFAAKELLLGNYSECLKLLIATHSYLDLSKTKKMKKLISSHWNDWDYLKENLPKSNERSVITFLKDHPDDFKRAIQLISPDILRIAIFAYQSHIWNIALSDFISKSPKFSGKFFYRHPFGSFVFYRCVSGDYLKKMKTETLYLPAHKFLESDEHKIELMKNALKKEGFDFENFKIQSKLKKKVFMKSNPRNMFFFPYDLSIGRNENDELNKDKFKKQISFILDKGSYATIIIKRITNFL